MIHTIARHPKLRRYLKAAWRIGPLALADALLLVAAYALVYSVRTGSLLFQSHHVGYFVLGAVLIQFLALYAAGAYRRIWSHTSGHDVSIIIVPTIITTAVVLALNLIVTPRPLPVSVVIVTNLVALNGFVGLRYRSRVISGMQWRWRAIWHQQFPQQHKPVLIVGAGEAGRITGLRLKNHYLDGNSDLKVIGYVDDDLGKQGLFLQGAPVLGTCDDIAHLAHKHGVDLIVLAIHNISGPRFREILTLCEKTTARIKIVPDVLELLKKDLHAPLLRDVQPEDLLGRQPIEWYQDVDAAPVTGKVVLVTGAAGSIGAELCRQMLRYQPVRLIMLDNNESALHDLYTTLQHEQPEQAITPVLADITCRDTLRAIFARYRPQLVFHAAAYKHVPLLEEYPHEAVRINVLGTLHTAEAALAYGVERFVLISTDKAVNPSSVMGASKRIGELLVQALPICNPGPTVFASVRFGNVLGSRGSVVPLFSRQIDAGGPVTVTDKRMVRYFMSIPEAVNLVIHAACLTDGNDLFMLRMGQQVPIIELAERMIRLRGLRPYVDIPIKFIGIRHGEKLAEELCAHYEQMHPTIHPSIVRLNGTYPAATLHRVIDEVRGLETLCQGADTPTIFGHLMRMAHAYEASLEPASTPAPAAAETG